MQQKHLSDFTEQILYYLMADIIAFIVSVHSQNCRQFTLQFMVCILILGLSDITG